MRFLRIIVVLTELTATNSVNTFEMLKAVTEYIFNSNIKCVLIKIVLIWNWLIIGHW